MATNYHLEAADTGTLFKRGVRERERRRRERITRKGAFKDDAILPVTFGEIQITPEQTCEVMRTLFWRYGRDRDQRIELLNELLGE
jgi:hypothetical protein